MSEKLNQLAKFLMEKYAEYVTEEVKKGNTSPSQADLVASLGIPTTTWSSIVNQRRGPSDKNLRKLGEVWPEVYDIWGVPRPAPDDPDARVVNQSWKKLTVEDHELIATVVCILVEEKEDKRAEIRTRIADAISSVHAKDVR